MSAAGAPGMSAAGAIAATLDRIEASPLNAFTGVLRQRALARAAVAQGPLAGMAFAVKNLFDVAGLPTRAGSLINRTREPATRDQPLIERLEAAGAVLVGTLNMGEYAYDFTGENVHDGDCRNPHDPERMAGGSSSGSGAAVGAGLVPLALGSDTNGSIRVPASFCGVFGLKPTYGRLTRARSFPFVNSLDHLGPLARLASDLVRAYDAMQGPDPEDPACAQRPPEPVHDAGIEGLRVAVAGGYFERHAGPEAAEALRIVAHALGATRRVELPEAARARAAAFVITTVEGAQLHLDRLRTRPQDFDPATRDRLIAGAMVPGAFYVRAQRFRRWFQTQVLRLFAEVDVILAPATPLPAPRLGQATIVLNGQEMPARASIGLLTQPISFIGLPVVAVPVVRPGMPVGVQVIAAPWREDVALRVALDLERRGVCASR